MSFYQIQAKVIDLNVIDKIESLFNSNFYNQTVNKDPCNTSNDKRFVLSGKQQVRQIIEIGDGYLIGGSSGQSMLLIKIDKNFKLVWSTTLELTQSIDLILSMKLTSDNNLVAVGSYSTGSNSEDDFIIKYDFINNKTIWVKSFEGGYQEIFFDVVENTQNGNYFVFGQKYDSNKISNALLVEFNSNTGDKIIETYIGTNAQLPSNTFYKATGIINNSGNNRIYTASRFTYGSSNEFMRPSISQFDLNGNLLWSKSYIKDVNSYSRLYLNHIFEKNGFLYAGGIGDLNGISLETNTVQLLKTDLDGNLIFAKDISISNSRNQKLERIFDTNDGIVLIINYLENFTLQKTAIIKLDYDGNILWKKTVGIINEDVNLFDLVFNSSKDSIILVGEIKNILDPGDLILLQLNSANGTSNCIDLTDPNIVIMNLALITYNSPIIPHTDFIANGTLINNQINSNFFEKYFCSENDLSLDSLRLNCNNTDSLFIRICNNGSNEFTGNIPVSIYNMDPEISSSTPIITVSIQLDLKAGECYETYIVLNSTNLKSINFAIINDPGNFNLPYDLESGLGFNPVITECNYVNNKKSFGKDKPSLELDLGNNILMCKGDDKIIGTNLVFSSYEWNTGAITSKIQVNSEGIFTLKAKDECANVYIDSIQISFVKPPNLGLTQNFKICPNDQITIGLDSQIKNIVWYTNSGIICNSCDSLKYSTQNNATVYFDYTFNNCIFQDSLIISIKPKSECLDCGILSFPNVFSPNTDGINDLFYPIADDCIDLVEELEIYNRWGGLVFKKNNFKPNIKDEGWNGIFNGQQAPIEVYVYKGSYHTKGGNAHKFKGDVTLIR